MNQLDKEKFDLTALFIGRFQPFHNGHLEAIREMLSNWDINKVIISVAAAQYSHLPDNPFTSGERIEMINSTLTHEFPQGSWLVVPVVDINDHAVWVPHIKRMIPPFDVCFTNNPLTKQLFQEYGIETRDIEMKNRKEWSASNIRNSVWHGDEWENHVPQAVVAIIRRVNGVQRINNLFSSDS